MRTSVLAAVRGRDAQCPSLVRVGTAEGSSTAATKKYAENEVLAIYKLRSYKSKKRPNKNNTDHPSPRTREMPGVVFLF
jgi:hypothetical protein